MGAVSSKGFEQLSATRKVLRHMLLPPNKFNQNIYEDRVVSVSSDNEQV